MHKHIFSFGLFLNFNRLYFIEFQEGNFDVLWIFNTEKNIYSVHVYIIGFKESRETEMYILFTKKSISKNYVLNKNTGYIKIISRALLFILIFNPIKIIDNFIYVCIH